MPVNKIVESMAEAISGIRDGATVMVSGFGPPGQPDAVIEALLETGVGDLTVINNNAGAGGEGISHLFAAKRVRKVVCSFPKAIGSTVFDELYLAGEIELELVPQGTLAERIRAAGAGVTAFFTPTGYGTELAEGKETRVIDGIPSVLELPLRAAFFTPTGYGTELAEGKETRVIDGVPSVLELPLRADFALVRAHRADRYGNLTYRKTGRNFGPLMAAAADVTIAEVGAVVPVGQLDPEVIVTPGIYVDRVVLGADTGTVAAPATGTEG